VLAIALSIALHEMLAGLIPATLAQADSPAEIVAHARTLRIATRPIATPTPHPVLSHPRVLTPVRTHLLASAPAARGTRRKRVAPGAAAPKPPAFSNSKPIWDVAAAGTSAGAGVSQSGNAGGAGGSSGDSASGHGSGAGDEPCGYVDFSDPHGSHFDPQTHGFWVDIRMTVHFADGSSQSTMLDYPWYYPSEAANPWSQANLRDPNFLPHFQPPPAAKASGEPPLVQYVIAHSTPDGLTLLNDCPAATPAS
jgi:hypothetical protein